MSGGSMGYLCYEIEEKCVGQMQDLELDALMRDLAKLLHDLEWYRSGDYGEETYRKTVNSFKAKWLGGKARNTRLKAIIEEQVYQVRKDLMQMLGEDGGESDGSDS